MSLSPFNLDFSGLPHREAAVTRHLDTPPTFTLSPPNAGWIWLDLAGRSSGEAIDARVAFSNIFSPLTDLWLWGQTIAANLAPVRVRIDEEGVCSEWRAEPEPDDRLRLTLIQEDADARPVRAIVWKESRAEFLARWGCSFAALFQDDAQPWTEWERKYDGIWPEPARGLPWHELTKHLVVTDNDWPRAELIARFYQLQAHHLRTRRAVACYTEVPTTALRQDILFDELRVRLAAAAWRAAMGGRTMPDCSAYETAYREVCEWLEELEPSPFDDKPPAPTVQAFCEKGGEVSHLAYLWIATVEAAVFARLPARAGQ
jgi:hypothetical protein